MNGLVTRAGRALRSLAATLFPAPDAQETRGRREARGARETTPTPRTQLRTTASVPAWVLRLALLLLCVACGAVVADGEAQWWVAAALGVLVAVRPHGALLAIAGGVLAGMLVLLEHAWWQLPALVLLTHALLRLGALADAVSWRGRVELGVLRDALPVFAGVQVIGQVAALVALLLDGAAPVPWLVVVAVGALGAVSWVLADQLRRA